MPAGPTDKMSLLRSMKNYRGRIAPSPTGYLHIGHAITFTRAQKRAQAAGGRLILRIEDLDVSRCRPEFTDAIIGDLKWFGLEWDEGPDVSGPFAPYLQTARLGFYLNAWRSYVQVVSFIPADVRVKTCSKLDSHPTTKMRNGFILALAGLIMQPLLP
jgi:hypothetical protein